MISGLVPGSAAKAARNPSSAVLPKSGSLYVWSAVGSTIESVVSWASAVAPSKTIAFAAFMVTVSTVVVVPFTVRFGTLSVPVDGL